MTNHSRLAWNALCVLDEAVERAGKAPVPATPALRLALACLAAIDGDEALYVEFWGVVRDPQAAAYSEADGNYQRRTNAEIVLLRISRQHGVERLAPRVGEAMRKAWAGA